MQMTQTSKVTRVRDLKEKEKEKERVIEIENEKSAKDPSAILTLMARVDIKHIPRIY